MKKDIYDNAEKCIEELELEIKYMCEKNPNMHYTDPENRYAIDNDMIQIKIDRCDLTEESLEKISEAEKTATILMMTLCMKLKLRIIAVVI